MKYLKGIHLLMCLFVCFLVIIPRSHAQHGFSLPANKKRAVIPFELVNNLVIVPVTLNGTRLSFLLDSGVDNTVLFSMEELDSLKLRETRRVTIKGLGPDGTIDAFLSRNNLLEVGKAVDSTHGLYMVLDRDINFSRRMGVPVHGILGYDFFSRFVLRFNYNTQRLVLYDPEQYSERRCRRCRDIPLEFERNKPYIRVSIGNGERYEVVRLLVDSGSSDGLWLFDQDGYLQQSPPNYFRDFLGLGLSGNIFGKRIKLPYLELGGFELTDVGTSIPDKADLDRTGIPDSRDGSLGGAILKRFHLVFDYPNNKMVLRPNRQFSDPFYYNMAGLVLEHDGLIPVREVAYFNINPIKMTTERKEASGIFDVYKSPTLEFFLAPRFVVAALRPGSPAQEAGLALGDEIISIDGKPSYKYKLYQINALFSSQAGRSISLKVQRNGLTFKKRFKLREVL